VKGGVVFWAWGEVSRDKTDYEHEYEYEPREAQPFTRFLEMVKANFIAAREIVIEFVFRLCENGFVPGSVTRPTGRIQ
jgi:hypothetical protein